MWAGCVPLPHFSCSIELTSQSSCATPKAMKKTIATLCAGALFAAACSSATSVDATLQSYCDKAAACVGNATSADVATCKEKATGYDKQLKSECVATYARLYDCVFAQATCTNKTLTIDETKATTACKTQAEEAAKCQAPPTTMSGAAASSENGNVNLLNLPLSF